MLTNLRDAENALQRTLLPGRTPTRGACRRQRRCRRLPWLSLGVLFLFPLPAFPGAGARVRATLLPEVTVRGAQITLGDLGSLEGDTALAAQARAVVVGQAPLPGRERTLDRDYIRIRLRQSRIDPDQVDLQAPPQVRVRGAGRTLTAAELLQAAESAVRGAAKLPEADRIVVEPLAPPAPLFIPEGELALLAEPLAAAPGSAQSIRLRVLVDGVPVAVRTIALRVRRRGEVWVAARPLAMGETVTPADVRREKRDLSGSELPLPVEQPVVGLRTRRALPAGSVLTAAELGAVATVRRGEALAVLLRLGGILIRMEARALGEGAVGEEIRVAATRDGREYRARITGPGSAQIAVGF